MTEQEPLIQGATDVSQRLRDLEEGRRNNQESAARAAASVVDLKEDVHDLKSIQQAMRDDFSAHRVALREDIGALTAEVRKTNGSVTELQAWRNKHVAETEPIIAQAREAFPTLVAIKDALAEQALITHDASVIKGFWKKLGRDTWQKLFATFGVGSAIALGVERFHTAFGWPW